MSYLNRLWTAACVAAENGHTDQGHKFSSGLKSLHHANKRFSGASDCRPLAAVVEAGGEGGDKTQQAEDSFRQVLYLNCWGQN
uniref:Uncharacterized protein n=1 Tax=Kalanchoe fedtschenkoi TaxID=63787 RepID=A0A7N0TJI5_KALFE